ncbi:Hypothetical protein NTJ_12513 [Nesidiocoris tenuis]|uniref:SUN domain-containing protein n=1 Tax=Nesidiocoris tenuis TaxID=355587 RepID=A0ABN7B5L2_9HEMI|nr:Hypothetical protein NTJ_12513 [Nesidiocoris tenuis]
MCMRTLKKILFHVSIGLLTVFLIVYFAASFRGADRDALKKRVSKGIGEMKVRLSACIDKALKTVGQCNRKVDYSDQFDDDLTQRIFEEEMRKFTMDRTGMTDFAMKFLGGTIVSSSYQAHDFGQAASGLLDPSSILEPDAFPGDCWAFAGSKADVVIRLFARIHVQNVTLEHIPPYISPTGDIKSAPRLFSVVGLDDPAADQGHSFGSYLYREGGPAVQTFPVQHPSDATFQFVRIYFQENHGNDKFTCVYRIRIHGERASAVILPPI